MIGLQLGLLTSLHTQRKSLYSNREGPATLPAYTACHLLPIFWATRARHGF